MKLAFYDFSVSPYSYDFVAFLIGARSHGCEKVVFVPGDRPYQKCTPEQQDFRMKHLMEPLAAHIGYTVCASRAEAKVLWEREGKDCFPHGYTVDKPVAGHMPGYASYHTNVIYPLAPKPEVLERVSSSLGCKLPITITIRESPIKPGRNSNIEEWKKAAKWLVAQGFWPLFIPDTEGPTQSFAPFDCYSGPAKDVDERIALYNLALLNLGVNNGPMAFCFWSQLPVLIYRYHDERFPETSANFLEKNLIPVGSQPRWFTDKQRIVWKDDTAENIIEGVKQWLAVRDGREQWAPHLVPPLPIKAVMADSSRQEHMAEALRLSFERGWDRLQLPPSDKIGKFDKPMTIVCYGPSLLDEIERIRSAPRPILTVSGAHDVLIKNGIIPDYHMDCDPREYKSVFTEKAHPDVTYLMASCAHPKHWENLKGHKVVLWHLDNGANTARWVKDHDPKSFLVCGGSNAGLRSMELGMILGYGDFHIFGMDCSFREKEGTVEQWAGAHPNNKQKTLTVHCGVGENREKFITSGVMIQGARELVGMIAERGLKVTLYGHGLAQKMLAEFNAGRFDEVQSTNARAVG